MRTLLRRLGFGLLGLLALLLALALAVAVFLWQDRPTPVEQLLGDDAGVDLSAWDGSDPPDPEAPSVLVLGSPHLAQEDGDPDEGALDAVTEALARYQPDVVAVEHLPPDWPVGRGRDYRPAFDMDRYAREWSFPREEAAAIAREARARPDAVREKEGPCRLGRAYFLTRDLANAHYTWTVHDCEPPAEDERFQDWWQWASRHEMARLGRPVARASGVPALLSIDDQSEDAGWFLYREAFTFEALTSPGDLWQMLPLVNPATRELSHYTEAADGLIDRLRLLNGPRQIGLQYWAYEQRMPTIDVRDHAGARQRDAYWRRNERMFARLHDAIERRNAERALVLVGAGHKYFLDVLVREAGYRWIDPRAYLPDAG